MDPGLATNPAELYEMLAVVGGVVGTGLLGLFVVRRARAARLRQIEEAGEARPRERPRRRAPLLEPEAEPEAEPEYDEEEELRDEGEPGAEPEEETQTPPSATEAPVAQVVPF